MANDAEKILMENFYKKFAVKNNIPENKAKDFIHTLFDYISDDLAKEDKVPIYKFGVFQKKWTKKSYNFV